MVGSLLTWSAIASGPPKRQLWVDAEPLSTSSPDLDDVTPDWACGVKLFVPITPEQSDELGVTSQGHHILALGADKRAIEQAFTPVRQKARPRH